MPTDKFIFYGFLSKTAGNKRDKLEELKKQSTTAILYEGIHRLESTIELIGDVFGSNHEVYVGLELTKKFEKHIHGKVEKVLKTIDEIQKSRGSDIKGEATIVIGIIINETFIFT